MREIKFRYWDSFNAEMRYCDSDKYKDYLSKFFIEHDDVLQHENNPILMQSLGIYDRKGKEIFEGDIIEQIIKPTDFNKEHFHISKKEKKIAVIVWDEENAGFDTQFEPSKQWHPLYERMRIVDADVKVLGNIFENPDLLKK